MSQPEPNLLAAEIYAQLAKLTAKIDVLITKMDSSQAQTNDHETRIRALEKARWPMTSVTVLVGVIALVVSIWPHLGK